MFTTFNGSGWDLTTHQWTSTHDDLNYLVSVVTETYPGWPFAVRNLQILPDTEAALLAAAAEEDTLPWFESDGTVSTGLIGHEPITVFASIDDLSSIPAQLRNVFPIQIIENP